MEVRRCIQRSFIYTQDLRIYILSTLFISSSSVTILDLKPLLNMARNNSIVDRVSPCCKIDKTNVLDSDSPDSCYRSTKKEPRPFSKPDQTTTTRPIAAHATRFLLSLSIFVYWNHRFHHPKQLLPWQKSTFFPCSQRNDAIPVALE
jgi:hypothetical protein